MIVAADVRRINAHRERRAFLARDPKHMRKRAQAAFNRWIVHVRDESLPCIACGATTAKRWNAGHYRAKGHYPALMYHEVNVHKQCAQCNSRHMRGGNLIDYRRGLLKRIGAEQLEWLEDQPRQPATYTLADYQRIIDHYRPDQIA